MRTLLSEPLPSEVKEFLERRKRLGQDRRDEVWEGVLHVVPGPTGEHADITQQLAELLGRPARDAGLFPAMSGFNVGKNKDDFRVPDGGLHRSRPRGTWFATAALVVEILSPEDDTWKKLPFYAAHNVNELLIIDPDTREVHWLGLTDGEYQPIERSGLIGLGPAQLAQQIDWP
jgi:Uma2 family endonuclease